jgi:hypothetical protein
VGQVNLRESINLLCGLLHRAYGRQVVLLIDEVDSPINELISAAAGDNNKDEEDQAFKLMSALITNALKLSTADDSLYRGILTGILPIAFEGLSSCDPGRWQVNNIRDEAK